MFFSFYLSRLLRLTCAQEETRLLVCLLLSHCREKPEASVEILFELLTVFLAPSLIDYSFLKVKPSHIPVCQGYS